MLIHGWGSSAAAWNATSERLLRAGIEVLTVDLRGHGASPASRDPLTIELLAGDVRRAIEASGLHRPLLMGHSGGGLIALALAASGGAWSGLVLLATAMHAGPPSPTELRLLGSELLGRLLTDPWRAEFILSRTMGPTAPFHGRASAGRDLAATPAAVRAEYFRLAGLPSAARGPLPRGLPVRVLGGAEDRVSPLAEVHATARSLGLASAIALEGRGHALPLEVPELIASEVIRLLDRDSGSPGPGSPRDARSASGTAP